MVKIPSKSGKQIKFHNQTIDMFLEKRDSSGKNECFLYTLSKESHPVPEHFHNELDEFFFVIEGEVRFIISGEYFIAKPGDFIPVLRGTLHGFHQYGSRTSKMWVTTSGASGLAEYFQELSYILNTSYTNNEMVHKFSELFGIYDVVIPEFDIKGFKYVFNKRY